MSGTRVDGSRERDPRQDGAVVVEFAVVFGLFVMLLAGLIQYGVIFAAEQALAHGASEATRAVVNIRDLDDDGSTQDEADAEIAAVLADQLSWLDGSIDPTDGREIDYTIDYTRCDGCVDVVVTYNWADDALVPALIDIATPDELSSSASIKYQ